MHIVHHSSEEYNFSVALRQSWFQHFMSFVFFLPLPLIGIDPIVILAVSGVSAIYQFWLHTKIIHKLPKVVELIFNTPSHHRVHHSTNPQYIDKNYAGIFIIWDRMFGTFELEHEEPTYGITRPFKSWNPVWANFHFYYDLLKFNETRGLFKMAIQLFKSPSDLSLKPQLGDQRSEAKSKPIDFKLYMILHFVMVLGISVFVLSEAPNMSLWWQIMVILTLLFSILILGKILDDRKNILLLELFRITMTFALIVIYYSLWVQLNLLLVCGIIYSMFIVFTAAITIKLNSGMFLNNDNLNPKMN
jgi:hypothetical protein